MAISVPQFLVVNFCIEISKVNKKINIGIADSESRNGKVREVEKLFGDSVKLLAPHRRFVKKGEFWKVGKIQKKKYWIFTCFSM